VQRTGFPVRLVKEPAIVSFRTEKRRFQSALVRFLAFASFRPRL